MLKAVSVEHAKLVAVFVLLFSMTYFGEGALLLSLMAVAMLVVLAAVFIRKPAGKIVPLYVIVPVLLMSAGMLLAGIAGLYAIGFIVVLAGIFFLPMDRKATYVDA